MNKLVVVRAGKTSWEEDRVQGNVPLPLSEAGKKELDAIVDALAQERPDCLYSGGNESSGPTAAYLAERCHLKARKMPGLSELDCGLWQGLRKGEIAKRFGCLFRQWRSSPTTVCPPRGESVQAAFERAAKSLAVLDKKHRCETVVIVAGRMVAGLIECFVTGGSLDRLWAIADQEDQMYTFELGGEIGATTANVRREPRSAVDRVAQGLGCRRRSVQATRT